MDQIIKGTEVIIPMRVGERYTAGDTHREEKKMDFWDRLENEGIDAVQNDINPYITLMINHLSKQNFWTQHNIPIPQRRSFVMYLISRGKIVYEAIIGDAEFAVGFLNGLQM
jgi:hypothetical protein